MKVLPIHTGNFKLDGGAMFGVVPKVIWNKLVPANENNLCNWSMRCLLVDRGDRKILIDTGIGNKQSEKFYGHYDLNGNQSLLGSLSMHGISANEITDVLLTHLHFDHCGGSVNWNKDKTGYELAFKNAKYWSNESHWEWATKPNLREKASFLSENILPIQESGHLHFIKRPEGDLLPTSELDFGIFFADGHTEKQMIPLIKYQEKTICFVADLLPTVGHLPLAYVMGYDTRPLLTMPEKAKFLNAAADNNYYLFLEHDAHNEIITVEKTEKGVRFKERFTCDEILR